LGLVLIFSFFGGLGGMAVVAGVWGFWDIIAGMALAGWWGRRAPAQTTEGNAA
jgi:BASS family bile acid:Na+ symporter